MGNGWRIARIAGIDVYLHWSFWLLLAFISFSNLQGGAAAIISSLLWIAAVFGCVVLHELGHALMARQFGVGTQDIVLLPIGGVARLNRIPEKPYQELAIAIAGPAVNVVIAVGLIVFLAISGGLAQLARVELMGQSIVINLLSVNIALVLFNMLPAFPMDGGRVLRAILAVFLPYLDATRVAAAVGQVLAVGLGLVGLFTPAKMLILIGLFIFFAGRAEAKAVAIRQRMRREAVIDLPPEAVVILPSGNNIDASRY